jgi:hypothetical protein
LGVLGGFIGFIRRYKIFYRIFYKNIKMFYNRTYAEVHYKKRKRKGEVMLRRFGSGFGFLFSLELCLWFRGAGGGEVSGGEHTTCSGGPRIFILTSAVYGERYYL